MAAGRLRIAAAAAIVATITLLAGCGGQPPDLGTIEPREPIADRPGPWRLVTVEGITTSASEIEPVAIEIDPDGRAMTVFFEGGNPSCYAVAGVAIVRRDPQPAEVRVRHGVRLGVMGCDAALYFLAIRRPLDPPFAP